jgi:oligoendopeptidase F
MLDVTAVPTRDRVPLEERWDLESVFPDAAAWESAYRAAEARLPELDQFRGRLGASAATLLAGLRLLDDIGLAIERVNVFAFLRQSEDAGNARANEMADQAAGLAARAGAAGSFVGPEIAAIPDATLAKWLADEPGLAQYRILIERIQRKRPHIRSAEVEAVLARAGEIAAVPEQVHTVLENGELPLGTIQDEEGNEVALAQGNVDRYLHSADRRVRRDAWEESADGYLAFQNTFAAALAGAVKRDNFYSQERRYATALEAALAPDEIPTSVFFNLIDTVWANFPVWHRYFRVRRRLLGLPEGDLQPWDLEAPLATSPHVDWDQGVDLVLGALEPLGEAYVEAVRQGIGDRWVDRAANAGKGGGAFSWGGYDTYPFISMTWHDDLGSVSTLIHELGHSMHSYLTARHQPFTYSDYGMSAAETASNFNQALLGAHLLAERTDRDWTLAVLEERMANYQRYLCIMPILARFELACHERVAAGDALPADWMNETLLGFYRQGYGDEVVIDPARIGITWARFPHLFSNFYVFQYGIGISAAAALATMVREEGEPARERYLDFLRAGGSKHSIEGLRDAGIDMRSPEPIQRAFDVLSSYVDRLESLVEG